MSATKPNGKLPQSVVVRVTPDILASAQPRSKMHCPDVLGLVLAFDALGIRATHPYVDQERIAFTIDGVRREIATDPAEAKEIDLIDHGKGRAHEFTIKLADAVMRTPSRRAAKRVGEPARRYNVQNPGAADRRAVRA